MTEKVLKIMYSYHKCFIAKKHYFFCVWDIDALVLVFVLAFYFVNILNVLISPNVSKPGNNFNAMF